MIGIKKTGSMASREKILKEIAQNKPAEIPLPPKFYAGTTTSGLVERYLEVLHGIGGFGHVVNDLEPVHRLLLEKKEQGFEVVNGMASSPFFNGNEYAGKTPVELETIETACFWGMIAVAENASVWLPEKNMVSRILPFICQHLVLVIKAGDIVANMHEAYEKITVDEDGYGAFIAGPSKTADIEQSLVIGAHGPLRLDVFIIN
jgi:L-lactate dehydrogenase complex protein LldG